MYFSKMKNQRSFSIFLIFQKKKTFTDFIVIWFQFILSGTPHVQYHDQQWSYQVNIDFMDPHFHYKIQDNWWWHDMIQEWESHLCLSWVIRNRFIIREDKKWIIIIIINNQVGFKIFFCSCCNCFSFGIYNTDSNRRVWDPKPKVYTTTIDLIPPPALFWMKVEEQCHTVQYVYPNNVSLRKFQLLSSV